MECGTAIGYSGLWIARELKALGHGKLITLEIDAARSKQARENFRRAGLKTWLTPAWVMHENWFVKSRNPSTSCSSTATTRTTTRHTLRSGGCTE